MRKERGFTLIELLTVLALLLFLGSLSIGALLSMVHRYQFNRAGKRVLMELNLTRWLSIFCQADVEFMIQKRGTKLFLFRTSDEPMELLGRVIDRHKEIAKVDRVGKLSFNQIEVEQILFRFYSTGRIIPEGEVELTSSPSSPQTIRIQIEEAPDFIIKK